MTNTLIAPRQGLIVSSVEHNSPAYRSGIMPGDEIVSAGGFNIADIVDFRFHASESEVNIQLKRDNVYHSVQISREFGEDIGIVFKDSLADGIHTCDNKCVFCFIHQMPKGMRKTLYLMDDDFRLSFLHGHYVTLTNLSEHEFNRIKTQKLSPIYVSVHAANEKLRGFMLGRVQPTAIIPRLKELHEAGIDAHCQIVLCPGLNDGKSLEATVFALANLHKSVTGLRGGVESVAVVPVGLSKYRAHLYPIRRVNKEYATSFLSQSKKWRKEFSEKLGTSFVFPSDEWFFYAEQPIPSRKWYENFPQFEDGIGTCRLFMDESRRFLKKLPEESASPLELTLITGHLPSKIIGDFANRLNEIKNVRCEARVISNRFFGEGITVAGLITGSDLVRNIEECPPAGIVAVPDIMLKDGYMFLDDITLEDVRSMTGCDIRSCPSGAREFITGWLIPLMNRPAIHQASKTI